MKGSSGRRLATDEGAGAVLLLEGMEGGGAGATMSTARAGNREEGPVTSYD